MMAVMRAREWGQEVSDQLERDVMSRCCYSLSLQSHASSTPSISSQNRSCGLTTPSSSPSPGNRKSLYVSSRISATPASLQILANFAISAAG